VEREVTSANAAGVVGAPGSELWPAEVTVVGANFGDLFLVPLDTPMGSDVISVDEALFLLVCLAVGEASGKSAYNDFPGDIHILSTALPFILTNYTLPYIHPQTDPTRQPLPPSLPVLSPNFLLLKLPLISPLAIIYK
jgi:hypothetical protein